MRRRISERQLTHLDWSSMKPAGMSADVLGDLALVARLRSRDEATLEAVVREYLPHIVRAARASGLEPHEADDLAQSTFITFLEKVHTFEGRSHIRTWLFGIFFHKLKETRRARERNQHDDLDDNIDQVMESRFDPNGSWLRPPRAADTEFEGRELRESIGDCLDGVPTKQRLVFVLREVEGLATDEICKILEVSGTNLGVMLYRARNRMRECLEAKGVRR